MTMDHLYPTPIQGTVEKEHDAKMPTDILHTDKTSEPECDDLEALLRFCALGDELMEAEETEETLYDVDEGSVLEGTGIPAHPWPGHSD